ncbi:hypothetical protein [Nocardioides sp. J54]|uniref:hypothetical protein n=1 Tax=Nocardioides sp. J54 TaxID=935866 RepID=UPI00048BB97E|nr:hypothetical protein [Nocardioides sp. J54]
MTAGNWLRAYRLRRRTLGDSGTVLIIALLITTVIAVVVGALLTRGEGSLRASVQLRQVAGQTYAADGAANVAINALRTGYSPGAVEDENWVYTNGRIKSDETLPYEGCFGWDAADEPIDGILLADIYPASKSSDLADTSAYVRCTPEYDTGDRGPVVPINSSNKPGYAIVTLGGNVAEVTGKDPGLVVKGGIYANGSVTGKVNVIAGGIRATGSCNGAQVVASPKNCNSGPPIPDPNYNPEIAAVPAWVKPPTGCTDDVAVFSPGYYDSASELNAATNLCGTLWFKPGNYYFDFHNDACANVCPSSLFGSGGNVWTINNKKIVAGTPEGGGNLPSSPTIPGACVNPIDSVDAVGVQFVFGGSSRMYVDQNSEIEFCGTYHPDRPPIVFYGLKTGSTPAPASANALVATTIESPGGFTNATAGRVNAADGGQPVDASKVATWNNTGSGAQTTTLSLGGFTPTTPVPPGAIVTSATLRVTHADSANNPSARVAIKVNGASTYTTQVNLPTHTANSTDGGAAGLAITGASLTDLQKQVREFGYSGATVDYVAGMRNAGTAHLDAISLDLTYYVPVLRGEVGTCVGNGTCWLIDMKQGNAKNQIYFQGTTYVPLADVRLLVGNFNTEIMRFGLIANRLDMGFWNGNSSQTEPVIEIPDNSPGFGVKSTVVQLEIFVCPNSGSCSDSGTPALTTRVQLWDPDGSPTKNERSIRILSWSHNR